MNRLSAVLLLLVLTACGGSGGPLAPSSPIDVRLTLAPGGTQSIGDSDSLKIRFDTVSEDSRCPMDAMCVWAGRAVARVTVLRARFSATVEIASDPASARVASAGDVHVEWEQLAPYPSAARAIQPDDYRLTVRVTR